MKKFIIALIIGLTIGITGMIASPYFNSTTITKVQFDQLKNGMSQEKVSVLLGGTGRKVVANSYRYEGDNSLGCDTELVYEKGQLIMIVGGIVK